jgi:single-strand DNA-binding protein
MSAGHLSACCIGNVTKDPEVRDAGKTRVANLSVAVNTKVGDKEHVSFITCCLWGKLADVAERWVRKGQSVFIQGELRQETWEKDGVKQSTFKLHAGSFQMLGGKRDQQEPVGESEGSNEFRGDGGDNAPF